MQHAVWVKGPPDFPWNPRRGYQPHTRMFTPEGPDYQHPIIGRSPNANTWHYYSGTSPIQGISRVPSVICSVVSLISVFTSSGIWLSKPQ